MDMTYSAIPTNYRTSSIWMKKFTTGLKKLLPYNRKLGKTADPLNKKIIKFIKY